MAIQTRSSAQKSEEPVEDTQTEQPVPNRATRRAAQKKESKESKVVKTTAKKTSRSSATRSGTQKTLNPKTTHYE